MQTFSDLTRPDLIVTCPAGVEDLLLAECQALGFSQAHQAANAVVIPASDGTASVADAFRICLYSRIGSRVLWPLAHFWCPDAETLYAEVREVPVELHLAQRGTFAVRCSRGEGALHHTKFAALRVKDAVVDRWRDLTGQRPDVDPVEPDVLLDLRLRRGFATLSIDLTPKGLHRRHQRREGGQAPLKENLAAAVLMRSGIRGPSDAPPKLIDPLCGSATLLVEAAGILGGCAPGLAVEEGFGARWKGFDSKVWTDLRLEAIRQSEAGMARLRASQWHAWGFDHAPAQIRVARDHVAQAQLDDLITLRCAELEEAGPVAKNHPASHLVANAPYGERLGESQAEVEALLRRMGRMLRPLQGSRAHMLIGEAEHGHAFGLRAYSKHQLSNGPLRCTLLHFELGQAGPTAHAEAAGLINRLRKNLTGLVRHRLAGPHGDGCFRLYDADLPQYAAAVDVFTPAGAGGHRAWAVVQEYAPPVAMDPRRCARHLRELCQAVEEVLEIDARQLVVKHRRKQHRDGSGYGHFEGQPSRGEGHGATFWVAEGSSRFWVELAEKVDCGLFMDHRPLRAWLHSHAQDRDVLNLFGYTGSLSVAAARGGARSTCTVDLSNTALAWAEDHLEANGLMHGPQHRLIRADVLDWLEQAEKGGERYDLALLNPPTFSRSKRMEEDFDLVRDYAALIDATLRLLRPGGLVIFSTHARRFKLDATRHRDWTVKPMHRLVRPVDFERPSAGCQAWSIQAGP